MIKKIIAVIAALAMVFSLSACGNYEITIVEKDAETKAASDSIEENEDEHEKEETEKEIEEDKTEKETEKKKDEKDGEFLATFDELRDYLSKELDLDRYANSSEKESSISYSMSYDENERTEFDCTLKVGGKNFDFPATYDDLKENGCRFANSMYNEKSEQPASTIGDYYFTAPGGGALNIKSLNSSDYDKPIVDCEFYGTRLYGYEFDNSASKKLALSSSASDFVINGKIDRDSSALDIINEFGMPNYIFVYFSEFRTTVQLKYTEGTGYSTDYLIFDLNYYDGGTYIETIDISYGHI